MEKKRQSCSGHKSDKFTLLQTWTGTVKLELHKTSNEYWVIKLANIPIIRISKEIIKEEKGSKPIFITHGIRNLTGTYLGKQFSSPEEVFQTFYDYCFKTN
jgi:hypothetical protein